MQRKRRGEDRLVSVPTAVTAARLALVPLFVWLIAQPHRRDWWPAAVLLAALGATDWLDGQLARRLHQVTRLGALLDPIADRALLAAAGIGGLVLGAVPLPLAAAAIAREATVAVGTLVLAVARAKRVEVTFLGRAGTFGLMSAFPLFLAGRSDVGWHHACLVLAWVAAIAGLALGWASFASYAPSARAALKERGDRGLSTASPYGALRLGSAPAWHDEAGLVGEDN
jgi:cardiolipin synthase